MVWQALKQQCAVEVESVKQEVQHKQRQAARLLKAKAEEEAIKVSPVTHILAWSWQHKLDITFSLAWSASVICFAHLLRPVSTMSQDKMPAVIECTLLCMLIWPAVQSHSAPVSHWCVAPGCCLRRLLS